jgi:predicted NBD/HSP70 family sugar kinase
MATLASQQRLREDGEAAVIAMLRLAGPLTRRALSERTDLGRTTVFEIVRDLIERSVLVEAPQEAAGAVGRGRPTTLVSLNPRLALIAGIELARGHARVMLVNAAHEEIGYGTKAASFLDDPAAAEQVLMLMRAVARKGHTSLAQIRHVGLGYSGIVDPLVPSENVQRLRQGLERALGSTVQIANSSHLATLAESMWGAARGHENVLYVHWSSGIGSGLVSRGQVLRGAHGMAGELGHVPVVRKHGPACYCGSRGCLEMFAGLEAMTRKGRELGLALADEHAFLDAAEGGDATARAILRDAAEHVGFAVATATVLLDPDIVVLGGEVSRLGDLVLAPIRAALARMASPRVPRSVDIRRGDLGERAAVRGAVALMLSEVRF